MIKTIESTPAPVQLTDEMAVRQLFQALNAAWAAGDAVAYAALFTEDADYLAFDGVNQKGRAAIIAGHKPLFEKFLKGSRLTGDIGCDGVHSRTRQFVLPDAPPPIYTGLVSASGFAHSAHIPPTPDTQHLIFGKRAFFGYLIKPAGEIYWFENHDVPGEPRRADLTTTAQAEWRAKLLALHHHDLPLISEIIRATADEIAVYPIYDIPTLPHWHRGPVMLIGDAAHATSPSAGQGHRWRWKMRLS